VGICPWAAAINPKRPPEPIPRGVCSCGSLRKASRRITQFYDIALAPAGLKSTQFAILAEIDRGSLGGPLSICELADAMVMDRSTLGHNLRPLERDELVVLKLMQDDRRKRYVELTGKGRAIFQEARQLWRQAQGQFERIFGKQPAAELRAVLLGIANNKRLSSPNVDR
jgi:DNA-binding MarR family transcriptional regulator